MPCNTVQTNAVNLEKVENHELLEAALKSEFGPNVYRTGARFIFTVDGQQVVVDRGVANSRLGAGRLQEVVGRVKQAYSREAVKLAAKRFGWGIEKGTDANNFFVRKG